MFDDNQHAQNLAFWQLCEDHSIYFLEFNADLYEVIIAEYDANKKACARNPKFPNKQYTWGYTMVLRVVLALTGPYAGMAP
jgi:hypothetical protein